MTTTILDVMNSPRLFGPAFPSPDWDTWRAVAAALFGLPMTDDQLALYRACTGRSEPSSQPFKEAALIVGRRGGKSRFLSLHAVYSACFVDHSPYLAPGEVATIAIICPGRKQAANTLRYVVGLLRSVPALAALIESETTESVTLTNRAAIEVHTASFRVTRGFTLACLLADESAFWQTDDSANPDTEILRAVRPALLTLPTSMLVLASSPYAKRGALYNAYRRHYGRDDGRVLVWKASTQTMHPSVDLAAIEDSYEEDPEAAKAEFGGEFRDDLADYVTRETVEVCVARGLVEIPPAAGVSYSGFCDPSGGAADSMTLAIAHLEQGTAMLDCIREVRPPFSPEAVVQDFAAVLLLYGVSRIVGDRWGGLWPVELFGRHGVTYEQSAAPKSDLYRELLPLLTGQRCQLLDHSRLIAQLCGLERRTARGGKDNVDHPPAGHDDICNCVAGVLISVAADQRPTLIPRDALLERGEAVSLPAIADGIFTTLATDASGGHVGICYWAFRAYGEPTVPLLLLDFACGPNHGAVESDINMRTAELATQIKVRASRLDVFTAAKVERHMPGLMANLPLLAMAAARYAAEGKLKKSTLAAERERTGPMAGALSFKAGDNLAHPLTIAALLGVAAALADRRALAA